MKSISAILLTVSITSSMSSAQMKADPNLALSKNKSIVIAPGCNEFIHPCSGQAATTSLNALSKTPLNKDSLPKGPAIKGSEIK